MHTLHVSTMKNDLHLKQLVHVALSLLSIMDYEGLQFRPLGLQEPYLLLHRLDLGDQFVLLVDELQFLIAEIRVLIDHLFLLFLQGVIQLLKCLHCTLL